MKKILKTLDPILGKTAFSKAMQLIYEDFGKKENSFVKNTAFNKNFGISTGQILEGAKLAETLGIEYSGILNNTTAKVAGKAYYCTANKSIFKCTRNTSINYADAGYFVAISNDDLLGKLENLIEDLGIKKIEIGNFSIATPSVVGDTKTISFKNSFAKVPILFISQTNYSGTTNEWAAIQTSKITTTNFIARHAGGTSNFTPTFYYVAIELLS